MSRALVLGGPGFVGVAACRELMRRGVETIAGSRTEHPYGTFTSHVVVDARADEQLRAALETTQPDLILDLTGASPGDAQRLASVFTGRTVVGSCRRDLPGIVIRSGSILGAGDPSLRIAAYIQRIEDGGPLLLPAESMKLDAGLAWSRDVGYAAALACTAAGELSGTFDVGFAGVSLQDLVHALGRALGRSPDVIPVPAERLPSGASPYEVGEPLNLERSQQELGFAPSALEDCLAEILAWYRVARPGHPGYRDRAAELALANQQ